MEFITGNMAWNGGLILALGFMIKLWMNTTQKKIDTYCSQNREDHKDINDRVTVHESRISKVEAKVER